MGAVLCSVLLRPPREPTCQYSKHKEIPMPKKMHLTLDKEDVCGREIIVIGDIHGCLDELKELIKISEEKYGKCFYVFVGDLINKGPLNCETLHFVRNLEYHVAVRGNHEERIVQEWVNVQNGTLSQFGEFYSWMNGLTREDMDYLINLPYTIRLPWIHLLIVHAGLSPWKHINNQIPQHMITMRNVVNTDILDPEETESQRGQPWASLWPGPDHVYFGHDARRRLQEYPFATGLDTGCLYGGELTAINVSKPDPKSHYIKVKAKKMYVVPGARKNIPTKS